MNVLEELSKAAARGVEVVIVTNDHPEAPLTLKWQQVVKRDHALVTFKGAGYVLTVIDCDGDASVWSVKHRGVLLAEGQIDSWKPYYHCDQACLAAEKFMRAHVAWRIGKLRGRR
jgi:hypothetical protein